MREVRHFAVAYFTTLLLAGCADLAREEMEAVSYVDIEEFMGTWYVIASIPTFLEKGALNPTERYSLNDDGTVATEFSYLTSSRGQQKSFHVERVHSEGHGKRHLGNAVRLANKSGLPDCILILRQQSRGNWSEQKRLSLDHVQRRANPGDSTRKSHQIRFRFGL